MAERIKDNRGTAIKVIQTNNEKEWNEIQSEIVAMYKLEHPNIITIYEHRTNVFFHLQSVQYIYEVIIMMEYAEYANKIRTLKDFIKSYENEKKIIPEDKIY